MQTNLSLIADSIYRAATISCGIPAPATAEFVADDRRRRCRSKQQREDEGGVASSEESDRWFQGCGHQAAAPVGAALRVDHRYHPLIMAERAEDFDATGASPLNPNRAPAAGAGGLVGAFGCLHRR